MQQQTIQTRINLESTSLAGPLAFLKGAGVAVSHHDGDVRFAVAEVVAALAEDYDDGRKLWEQLVLDEPEFGAIIRPATFILADGSSKIRDSVDIEGVFRLAQSIRSRTAERVKRWLSRAARQRLEESTNPPSAVRAQ